MSFVGSNDQVDGQFTAALIANRDVVISSSRRRYYFILNGRAGTASSSGLTADALRGDLQQAGHQVIVDDDDEAGFESRIARPGAGLGVGRAAAGGPGTVSSVAEALIDSDKVLAVLPLGTVNSLAKDLGMPLDLKTWIGSLAGMETQRIDVGEVNDRIFLHMVVIGLIPGMAAGRELLRGRTEFGAKIGLLRYFHRRLSRARRMVMQIDPSNDAARIERVQAVAITCNAYDEGFGRILTRQQLDAGELTIYQVGHLNVFDAFRLALEMFLGRWQQDRALKIQKAPSVVIRSHKPKLQVMLDGEIENIDVPLQFRIRPRALQVLSAPMDTANG
jgi:diacylglycerol kinase family enzyme